jgi:hypothetical protein
MSFFLKLFSSKKKKETDQKSNTPVQSQTQAKPIDQGLRPKHESAHADEWVVDSILNFVNCPVYRNDIEDFKETNCINFKGQEENSHQDFLLHKAYVKLLEEKVDYLIALLDISEDQFIRASMCIYADKRYRNFVEELFSAEDFAFFKKMMHKKNRQLERELRKFNSKKEGNIREEVDDEAELNYALELSKKLYEDNQLALAEEERQLQMVLQASKLDSQPKTDIPLPTIAKEKPAPQINDDPHDVGMTTDEMKLLMINTANNNTMRLEIQSKLEKERQELAMRMEDLRKMRLPLLENEKRNHHNSLDETNLDDSINPDHSEPQGETPDQRRERLLKQREALIVQKRKQREVELAKYNEQMKQSGGGSLPPVNKESEKHKQIYTELKNEKKI